MSKPFDTSAEIRERCVISPLLFPLILNYMHDILRGKVNVRGRVVKVLMFSDVIDM